MMRDEDTEMTEIPQVGPHEQQAGRVLGVNFVQFMDDMKNTLNNLGMAVQRIPNDVASRVLAIQGEEKQVGATGLHYSQPSLEHVVANYWVPR